MNRFTKEFAEFKSATLASKIEQMGSKFVKTKPLAKDYEMLANISKSKISKVKPSQYVKPAKAKPKFQRTPLTSADAVMYNSLTRRNFGMFMGEIAEFAKPKKKIKKNAKCAK